MKERKVISTANLPTKVSGTGPLLIWLLLDRWHAPEWGFAVFWTLWVFIWLGQVITIYAEKRVNIENKL